MWARVIELMLAGWLAFAALVTSRAGDGWPNATDLAFAALAAAASLACWFRPLERMHLATLVLGGLLALLGFAAGHPASPVDQNRLVVGLLLMMFAVVPSRSSRPPRAWSRELH